ncbi:hypothetical protein GCM10008936_17120 [Alkalibacterium indicireducens]|uniref:Alkyl sulfatase dimerisation domain-containing protein n=2 Tax=Alkalibacterium indicireducens TaxID=398758 RepID=A0ABP3L0M5_9LACT
MARTVRQFGYNLSDEEAIGQGIGIREGHAVGEGKYDFLSPTEYINKETILDIDGVSIHLAPAPGETDDTGLIWIPEEQVLCIGDNYYACWPNLYALRGGKYRDIAQWIDSLELLLSYDSEVVLPGHTDPLIGKSKVQLVLNNYKESLKEILLQTLDYMNLGYAVDEVIKNVKLPSHLQSLPYMEEFYGTVEWSIKSIYSAYLGWFDGNPTNTNKLSKEKYSEKLLSLIENKEKIMSEIVNDNDKEDLLWAMELCDLLLNSKSNNQKEINILKAKIMLKVADYETSANSRHYYIEYAKEILKNEKEIGGNSNGL